MESSVATSEKKTKISLKDKTTVSISSLYQEEIKNKFNELLPKIKKTNETNEGAQVRLNDLFCEGFLKLTEEDIEKIALKKMSEEDRFFSSLAKEEGGALKKEDLFRLLQNNPKILKEIKRKALTIQ